MLPGHKAQPGNKVPAALECTKIGGKRGDRAGGSGADAGNGAKSTHIFIRLGSFSKLQHQPIDLLSQQPDLVQVKLTNLSNSIREIICLISQNAHHRSEIGWPLSKDDSKLTEVPAQRIDELGALAHEAMVRSERHRTRLMFSALDCNVVHVRP